MKKVWGIRLSAMFLMVCAVLPFAAKARTQDSQSPQNQSVADVARRSREQKKNAARQSRVITNDDVDRGHSEPGQDRVNIGAPAAPQTGATSASTIAAEAADRAITSAEIESEIKSKESEEAAAEAAEIVKLKEQLAEVAEILRLKDQLAEAQNQLKWQQRELMLEEHTIYSNPNYTDYRTGQATLNTEQQRINERQQEIEALKGSLAELEWRQWRRKQAFRSKSSSPVESYKSASPPTPPPPQP